MMGSGSPQISTGATRCARRAARAARRGRRVAGDDDRALVLPALVDDRVELLEHPVGALLGAEVVEMEQVDRAQPPEEAHVGAAVLAVVGVLDLGQQARDRVDRDRPAALFGGQRRRASPARSCPCPTSPANHRPLPGVHVRRRSRSTNRGPGAGRTGRGPRSACGRRTRRGSAWGPRCPSRRWARADPALAAVARRGRVVLELDPAAAVADAHRGVARPSGAPGPGTGRSRPRPPPPRPRPAASGALFMNFG